MLVLVVLLVRVHVLMFEDLVFVHVLVAIGESERNGREHGAFAPRTQEAQRVSVEHDAQSVADRPQDEGTQEQRRVREYVAASERDRDVD